MNEALHGDVNPHRLRRGVNGHAVPPQPEIRRATLDDAPFLLELAREKYPARQVDLAANWLKWCIESPDRLVLIGPNSAGIAQVQWNYGFERRARLDALAARPTTGAALEALRIVRLMIDWAKQQGAVGSFRLDADTGVDFGPFAKRLGGRPVTMTRYEIPL